MAVPTAAERPVPYVVNDQFFTRSKGEKKKAAWKRDKLLELTSSCGKNSVITFENPKKVTAQLALSLFRTLEKENANSNEFLLIDISNLGPGKVKMLKAKFKEHLLDPAENGGKFLVKCHAKMPTGQELGPQQVSEIESYLLDEPDVAKKAESSLLAQKAARKQTEAILKQQKEDIELLKQYIREAEGKAIEWPDDDKTKAFLLRLSKLEQLDLHEPDEMTVWGPHKQPGPNLKPETLQSLLVKLPKLQILNLNGVWFKEETGLHSTDICKACLQLIAKVPTLYHLSLQDTLVTAADVSELQSSESITSLNLRDIKTLEGEGLELSPHLQSVDVTLSLYHEEVETLRDKYPNLRIISSF